MTDSVYVIAEAGVNHNGSIDAALRLVDVAVTAGADAVKFQTFRADELVTRTTPKAAYQVVNTNSNDSQYDMLRALELDLQSHRRLKRHCDERGITFLSTPFDCESLRLLIDEIDVPLVKISSGDLTNAPLLWEAARSARPMIVSTGMSTLGEVETALGVVAHGYFAPRDDRPDPEKFRAAYFSEDGQRSLRDNVTLLHCTTEYPTPFDDVNLRAMDTLKAAFGLPVGFSDHTEGVAAAVSAVARGACVIEKHFTLDRGLPGPDHRASLDPEGLKLLVRSIREAQACLGAAIKRPAPSEMGNIRVARRGLVAKTAIVAGELFSSENIAVKRIESALSPLHYWDLIGRPADRDYVKDERIAPRL